MAIITINSMFGTSGAIRMLEFCRDKAIEIRAHIDYGQLMETVPGYFRSLLAPWTGTLGSPQDIRDALNQIYMMAPFRSRQVLFL